MSHYDWQLYFDAEDEAKGRGSHPAWILASVLFLFVLFYFLLLWSAR